MCHLRYVLLAHGGHTTARFVGDLRLYTCSKQSKLDDEILHKMRVNLPAHRVLLSVSHKPHHNSRATLVTGVPEGGVD